MDERTDEQTNDRLSYFVPGLPIAKGSWAAIWNPHIERGEGDRKRKGACVLVAKNSTEAKAWAKAIQAATLAALVPRQMSGPVGIDIVFWLPRAQATNQAWRFRDIRPDVDKLLRQVLDTLTGVAWRDDCQVCDTHAVKRYVSDGGETGAQIQIWPMAQSVTLFDDVS